jgi:predicted P-loop ATPase
MLPKELNKLKGTMTMPSINERGAYERYHKNRPHLASFCGTGNNVQFLSDTTGTRRWLPFEVESIEPPQENPLDYDAIYAQAYTLYQQGFRYWFDQAEIQRLTQHNRQFETSRSAEELIDDNFRKPKTGEKGEHLSSSVVMQIVGAQNMKDVSAVKLGRAFTAMGFDYKIIDGIRRYHVVRRQSDEIKLHREQPDLGAGGSGEVW